MDWLNGLRDTDATLGELDAPEVGELLRAGSDIVLLIDEVGTVRDAAFRDERLRSDLGDTSEWLGRNWTTLVTVESRAKIESLLGRSIGSGEPSLRHVNYPSAAGPDIAVGHTAIRVGRHAMVAAFGHDLRPFTDLQQKLVDAQEAIERDYSMLREVETRARQLFDGSGEALVTVGATTLRLIELNPSATRLFGTEARKGRSLSDLFGEPSQPKLRRFLATLQANGAASPVALAVERSGDTVSVSGSLLQGGEGLVLLIRIEAARPSRAVSDAAQSSSLLLEAVENAPDGFVCTDEQGRILAANAAFLAMIEVSAIENTLSRGLDEWLGREGIAADVMLANLRQRGSLRLFPTTLRGAGGGERAVEVSAASIIGSEGRRVGFTFRDVTRRLVAPPPSAPVGDAVPPPDRLTDLVGRVPLKDLVRDATDVIERLCMEQALKLANDNRAAAAEMLGLSRQSFYIKLRRFGLGQLAENDE